MNGDVFNKPSRSWIDHCRELIGKPPLTDTEWKIIIDKYNNKK